MKKFIADKINTIGSGLPSLGTLLFNRPARGSLLKFSLSPVLFNNDESNHTAFINRQVYVNIDNTGTKISHFLPKGSTVAMQCEYRVPGCME